MLKDGLSMCATTSKDKGECRKTNMVYKVECTICTREGERCHYWGETARSGYLRGAEHRGEHWAQRDTGHMTKHMKERHDGPNKQKSREIL